MGWFSQRPPSPSAADLPQEPPDPKAIRERQLAQAQAAYQQWLAWCRQELLPRVNSVLQAQSHTSLHVGEFTVVGSNGSAKVWRVDGSWDWTFPVVEALTLYTERGYTVSLWGRWHTGASYRSPGPHLDERQLEVTQEAVARFLRERRPRSYFVVRIRS